jgi:hypothetical protein
MTEPFDMLQAQSNGILQIVGIKILEIRQKRLTIFRNEVAQKWERARLDILISFTIV